jgi:hypothetical protein
MMSYVPVSLSLRRPLAGVQPVVTFPLGIAVQAAWRKIAWGSSPVKFGWANVTLGFLFPIRDFTPESARASLVFFTLFNGSVQVLLVFVAVLLSKRRRCPPRARSGVVRAAQGPDPSLDSALR